MQWDDIPPVVNYLRVRAPGHPLAATNGTVQLHRWLVYRRLGPGPHPCHWCGDLVDWLVGRRWAGVLIVDHIDGNKGNNVASNLVASCHPCNIRRGRHLAIRDGEVTVRVAGGLTRAVELTCQQCGDSFLTRTARASEQRFCTRRCQAVARAAALRVGDDEAFIERRAANGTVSRLRAARRICEQCGIAFLAEHARIQKRGARFCSPACSGRAIGGHPNRRRGEASQQTSLTDADVREMRRIWAAGGISQQALGARFGVSKTCAGQIVRRQSWNHIT